MDWNVPYLIPRKSAAKPMSGGPNSGIQGEKESGFQVRICLVSVLNLYRTMPSVHHFRLVMETVNQ